MHCEIVRYNPQPDEHGWVNNIVVAVDGIRSIEFSVHRRELDKLRTTRELEDFLKREGAKYVGMFGDGRNPRPLQDDTMPIGA